MIGTILFDLDGTLLPMDIDEFTAVYFEELLRDLVPLGIDGERLTAAVWRGTAAMFKNDGSRLNSEAFWETFKLAYPDLGEDALSAFDRFYAEGFDRIKRVTHPDPRAAQVMREVARRGFRAALATSPIFPPEAARKRLAWAGLDPRDFELITSFENSRYAKPSAGYYLDIARTLGVAPEECLMVGNNVQEDMAAREVGMEVFLLTDCLLNPDGGDITVYPHGSFPELLDLIASLPKRETDN